MRFANGEALPKVIMSDWLSPKVTVPFVLKVVPVAAAIVPSALKVILPELAESLKVEIVASPLKVVEDAFSREIVPIVAVPLKIVVDAFSMEIVSIAAVFAKVISSAFSIVMLVIAAVSEIVISSACFTVRLELFTAFNEMSFA